MSYYIDYSLKDYVENPGKVEAINLITVNNISFSTREETLCDTIEFPDNSPREYTRDTYLVVSIDYEYNNEYDRIVKNTSAKLCSVVFKDDGLGNIVNESLNPEEAISKEYAKELILDAVLGAVSSKYIVASEKAFVNSAVSELNEEFDLAKQE